MKAIAIILAAGESARMGLPKALLDSGDGVSFVARLAATFAEAGVRPLVVVGAHAEEIRAAHPELKWVRNARWTDGQLSSVKVGLRAALAQGADRLLIHPVDAPLLAAKTVRAVVEALALDDGIVPNLGGRVGHPVGLSAKRARALLTSKAETLAAALAEAPTRALEVDDAATLDNLNSADAYRQRFGVPPRLARRGG